MRKRKFKVYRKIYPKARGFARREYVDGFELEPLEKGYYNGFVEGAKAMFRQLPKMSHQERVDAEHYLFRVLGEPKEI